MTYSPPPGFPGQSREGRIMQERLRRALARAARWLTAALPLALSLLLALELRADTEARTAEGTSAAPGEAVTLRIAGSGYTMPLFTTRWAEAYSAATGRPVAVERKGTSTGPPALLTGKAQIASMTRPMNVAERTAFRRRLGYEATAVAVAADALAVFVHESNPLERMTLGQVDAVFSAERRCGGGGAIRIWGELGLDGPFAGRTIDLYGRHPNSGTGTYFSSVALCGGPFTDRLRVSPGRASAARAVADSRTSIGFASRADRQPGIKLLALAKRREEPYVPPTAESIYSGRYPLARQLYFYVQRPPGGAVEPSVADFLRYVLSSEAQQVVEEVGYLQVPPDVAAETLASLGLDPSRR